MDPLIHSVFWSLALNTAAFFAGSILTFPDPVERIQGAAFVNAFDAEAQGGRLGWTHGQAEPEALLNLAQRILSEEALTFFEPARAQGEEGYLPDMTPAFLTTGTPPGRHLERHHRPCHDQPAFRSRHGDGRELDGRGVLSRADRRIFRPAGIEPDRADPHRPAVARGEQLTQISVQKDAFLSQISHELRTPMTSIRAFSEI